MTYTQIVMERRGAATLEEAERIFGGPGMLRKARDAKWLEAKILTKGLTLFDYDECVACWKRIALEGYDALKKAAEKPMPL